MASVPDATETADLRRRLLEAAAQLLGEEGPGALSTRRLAREAGTSTMSVYTYFGGMPALVREIVTEGFARLAAHMAEVRTTDDPLEDLRALAVAYRDNALENPHLYAVMFGSASLGGYRLTDEDRAVGDYTFRGLVASIQRAVDEGALRPDTDPEGVAAQLWSALHGYVMLELGGFQTDPGSVEQVLWPMLGTIVLAHLSG